MSIFGTDPVRSRVRGADLAGLEDAALASLDVPRHALLRAYLAATEARLAARRARDDHDRIAARKAGAKADVKLAKAELGAARAHTDAVATEAAGHSVAAARADRGLLDRQIAWLRAEVAAAEAHEDEADAAAWAAEADYELARARVLVSDPSRGDVSLPVFVRQAEACHKTLEDARQRFVQRRAQADTLRNAWEHARGALPEHV
ncbi:MAG: hypothetical protein ACOZNI_30370 [Myxococcota bacterium]